MRSLDAIYCGDQRSYTSRLSTCWNNAVPSSRRLRRPQPRRRQRSACDDAVASSPQLAFDVADATWLRVSSRLMLDAFRPKVLAIERTLAPLQRSSMSTARSSTLKCRYCLSIATPYVRVLHLKAEPKMYRGQPFSDAPPHRVFLGSAADQRHRSACSHWGGTSCCQRDCTAAEWRYGMVTGLSLTRPRALTRALLTACAKACSENFKRPSREKK